MKQPKYLLQVALCMFTTLLIASCLNDKGDDQGALTINNEVIKLAAGEKSTAINKLDKFTFQEYQRNFNSVNSLQCPLNKVFHSNACRFYYGIPLNSSVPSLYNAYLNYWGNKKITSAILADSSEGKIVAKDSANYILAEFMMTPGKNILLGGAVSSDSSLIMSYYEQSNLKTRISNEK